MKRIGGTLLCNRLTDKPQNYKKISLRFATSVHHELQILQIVHACGLAKEQLCLIYTETQTEENNDKTIRRSPFALLHRTMHHELQILEIFHACGIAKEQLCFINTEKQTEKKDGDHG